MSTAGRCARPRQLLEGCWGTLLTGPHNVSPGQGERPLWEAKSRAGGREEEEQELGPTEHSPHLPTLPVQPGPGKQRLMAEASLAISGQWARPRAEEVTTWKEPEGNRSHKGRSLGTSSPPAQALPPDGLAPRAGGSHLPSSHKAWAGQQGYQGGASSGLQTGQDPTSSAPGGRGEGSLGSGQTVGCILEPSVRRPGNWRWHQPHQLSSCC